MGVTLLTDIPDGVNPKQYHNEMHYFPLLKAIEDANGSLTQAAWLCEHHQVTVREWVAQGDNDLILCKDTPLAHLSVGIRKAQAAVVKKLVDGSLSKKYNAKFVQWWLGVVFKQQFGIDSGMLEYLLEKAHKLEQSINKINFNARRVNRLNTGSNEDEGSQSKELDKGSD